ncbi:MAG: hypothetical protein ACFIN6_00875 [Candidatus Walczuchella monophlebidarum]
MTESDVVYVTSNYSVVEILLYRIPFCNFTEPSLRKELDEHPKRESLLHLRTCPYDWDKRLLKIPIFNECCMHYVVETIAKKSVVETIAKKSVVETIAKKSVVETIAKKSVVETIAKKSVVETIAKKLSLYFKSIDNLFSTKTDGLNVKQMNDEIY